MAGIFWIEGNPNVPLAIVLCPHGGRGLGDEMRQMKRGGIETLVSLLEVHEADMLDLAEEPRLAMVAGLRFLSHPIPDTHIPQDEKAFRAFVTGLAARLRAGERMGLHCRGSIGRAPMTAACTLIQLGWQPGAALEAIETARGMAVPDTREQEAWILSYKAEP
jgi:protein-tyrosine phosphatase